MTSAVDCPSCGSRCAPDASACARCGRRFAWDSTPVAPAQSPGTLFGDEPGSPWGHPDVAPAAGDERLDEARSTARRSLIAAVAGIVATIAFVQVFRTAPAAPPDPNASDYHVASVIWGSASIALTGARLVVALFAVGLAAYALVRGISTRTLLAASGESALASRALSAALLGGAELLVMLATVVATL